MKYYEYFPIENTVINIYKNIDWGNLLASDLYELYTPTQYDNLMSIAFKKYQTINDWWVIYYFNKMIGSTFAILPTATINATIDYYINLLNNYSTLSVTEKLKIKECLVNFFIYGGDTYDVAIIKAIASLNDILFISDPLNISDLKDFLFMHIMSDTTYNDPIKIPNMQVVYRMKSIMNQYEIEWMN